MRALEVFFCRREYVFPGAVVVAGVLRRAAVGEGWRVNLEMVS